MALLKLNGIGFRYDGDQVLKNVSFDVAQGEFLGIIGPNGSGKSTLLKIIDGILKAQEGTLHLDGRRLHEFKRSDVAKIIGFVPQDFSMIFPFSVKEIVLMGRAPHLGRLRFESESDCEIARKSMEVTDTECFADRSMNELSAGEVQRVLIARALTQEPRIILLDEPTAYLDIRHQITIFDLIRKLNREQALTVITVTHDINLSSHYCDRILLLKEGAVRGLGAPEKVITESTIRDVYDTLVMVDKNPKTGAPRITLI
jgi:iron complex transport system ATP-binding protein